MSERGRVFHPSGGPLLVKRSEQDATDVNLIMDSWIHAGAAVAGHMNRAQGAYGDFSSGIDYHSALDAVKEAEKAFAKLPPKVRSHVDNDPGKYLDMLYDPDRREELEELGIVEKSKIVVVEAPVEPGQAPVAPVSTSPIVPEVVPRVVSKGADPAGDLFD